MEAERSSSTSSKGRPSKLRSAINARTASILYYDLSDECRDDKSSDESNEAGRQEKEAGALEQVRTDSVGKLASSVSAAQYEAS